MSIAKPPPRRTAAARRRPRGSALLVALVVIVAAIGFIAGIWFNRHATPAMASGRLKPLIGGQPQGRVPGEFEHQDGLLVGCNELVEYFPETLVDIVSATSGKLQIIGLVANEDQRTKTDALLRSRGISLDSMHYFVWPARSMWVQDFGPLFVVGRDTTIVDFEYYYPNRGLENLVPAAFASLFDVPLDYCDLNLEGGAWLTNGQGLCLMTNTLLNKNVGRGHELSEICRLLKQHLNFETLTHLEPLSGEPLGHIDMFMALVAPNVAVVGSYDPEVDPANAKILDDNTASLESVTTRDGPMQVVRLPMPSHADGKWRTYTNVVFANGVLLVPQYPDVSPELDRQALAVFHRVLPDWKIIGIDSSKLIEKNGALHCVTLGIPKLPQHSEAF